MTTITFFKHDGLYYGFTESGHAGYAEAGQDTIDEDTTDVTVKIPSLLTEKDEKKRFAVSGLLQGYFIQLMDMLEDYYDYLSVEETEV